MSVLPSVMKPPPIVLLPTAALLSTLLPMLPATATVSVIGAMLLLAGIAVLLVQVTTWPATPQVQPVPVPET